MKRKLALFMVLAMLISLVPMNVFAGTTNTVNAVPTVKDGEDGQAILSFEEKVDTDFATTGTVFKLTITNADILNVAGDGTFFEVVSTTDNTAIMRILSDTAGKDTGTVTIDYEVTEEANVTIDIDGMDSAVTSQDGIIIAKGSAGATRVKVSSVKTMGEAVQTLGDITIEEMAGDTLKLNDIGRLKLPSNFEWQTAPTVSVYGGVASAVVNDMDGRDLEIKVTVGNGTTARGGIILTGGKIVAKSAAKYGEVFIAVSSIVGDFTSESVKVADYTDFGVTVKLDKESVPTIYSGDWSSDMDDAVKLQKIVIKEDVANSIVSGRKINIAFPEGVKIVAYDVTKETGMALTDDVDYFLEDSNDMEFTATVTAKAEMHIVFYVSVAADFEGDITATVSGKALGGEELKVVAGKAVKKAAFTVETKDVKLGLQKQAMGTVVITEPAAGVWEADQTVVVSIPDDFSIDTTPEFEVTKGDLEIKNAKKNSDGDLEFTVKSESGVASEVTIKGGTVKLTRNLPEGDYKINVGGEIIENYLDPEDIGKFDVDGVGSKVAFRVITPAPGDTKAGETVVFTIGSAEYMVGANKVTSDVAPYINEQGRTMLPLRALANALGVVDSNIMWNEVERSVTIFKGDATIKVVIGEMSFMKNGVSVPMDTNAVIMNGRTMLPLRAIGQAMGATIVWDEATRTVTVN